jgi:hypothetical protein
MVTIMIDIRVNTTPFAQFYFGGGAITESQFEQLDYVDVPFILDDEDGDMILARKASTTPQDVIQLLMSISADPDSDIDLQTSSFKFKSSAFEKARDVMVGCLEVAARYNCSCTVTMIQMKLDIDSDESDRNLDNN